MPDPHDDPAAALGRIPSGIFILTTGRDGRSTGMLASWVQQAGFDPPMLTVAVRRDRYVAEWIAASGKFTLNQVAAGDKSLLKHFGRGFEPGDEAFTGIPLRDNSPEGPVLAGAMAFVKAEVAGFIDGGDHRVFLARVVEGRRVDAEAEPMIHLRKSGLHY
jgi:flavin reductase (DIM6/NTAB) family NADH-FMN oxidoreductase RutF